MGPHTLPAGLQMCSRYGIWWFLKHEPLTRGPGSARLGVSPREVKAPGHTKGYTRGSTMGQPPHRGSRMSSQ